MCSCKADGKGGQTIENTGPLTKKRMETIDEETLAAAKDFIKRQHKAGQPFFCWWNGTRMHFRTHVKKEHRHPGNDEYTDGMIEHDGHVGELLKLIDELGIADNTIVQYSTDNGPHYNTWPDAGTMPFRSEKNSNWEGAYRVPCFVRWPGQFPAGRRSTASSPTRTGCPPLPPPPARRTSRRSSKGVELNGRQYRNHIDGYNQLDYLSGKTKSRRATSSSTSTTTARSSPCATTPGRRFSWRTAAWHSACGASPSPSCVCRCCSTCAATPSSVPSTTRTPTTTGSLTAFSCSADAAIAAKFLMTMKDYPPSQTPGSFNLEKVQKQIEAALAVSNADRSRRPPPLGGGRCDAQEEFQSHGHDQDTPE